MAGLGLVLLTEVLLRVILIPEAPTDIYIIGAVAFEWFVTAFLLGFWVPLVESLPLRSLGLTRFRWRYLWLGTAVFSAQLLLTIISGVVLEYTNLRTLQNLGPLLGNYGWLALLGLFSAAFFEEVFYRGYLIERLTLLTGSLRLAASVSWLSFTLIHLEFFGLGPTLQISILAAALVLTYTIERSVWPCMVVHGINNTFAYLLFPWLDVHG
jgi:CAAX protease family protein